MYRLTIKPLMSNRLNVMKGYIEKETLSMRYPFQPTRISGAPHKPKQVVIVLRLRGTTGIRGTQRQLSENICSSEGDLRSRIFGTFVVKCLACLLLLGFSNI